MEENVPLFLFKEVGSYPLAANIRIQYIKFRSLSVCSHIRFKIVQKLFVLIIFHYFKLKKGTEGL
jgi:hypothetical protein